MGKFVEVANTSEVPRGETKCVEIEGHEIALFNLDGEFYAIGNTCTMRAGPFARASSRARKWSVRGTELASRLRRVG